MIDVSRRRFLSWLPAPLIVSAASIMPISTRAFDHPYFYVGDSLPLSAPLNDGDVYGCISDMTPRYIAVGGRWIDLAVTWPGDLSFEYVEKYMEHGL